MKIAFISDIHEDITSLQNTLRKIDKNKCDKIVCLGDISGFSKNYKHKKKRDAKACLKLVRENCIIIIAGNHDLLSAKKLPKNNPDFIYPENWYQLDYQQQAQLSNKKVWLYEDEIPEHNFTDADLDFLKSLAEYKIIETNLGKILFSHYAFPNLTGSMSGFYDSEKSFSPHLKWMNEHGCKLSFMGHHHPYGIIHVTEKRLREKHLSIKIKPGNNSLFVLPPLVKHKVPNRFCIFDTLTKKLKIKRI